jgi:nucleoside-diphosphate-sugar epimerase
MPARTVLVTGATGFVGSHVVDQLLQAGEKVRVLVRATSNLRWLEGKDVVRVTADLRDPEDLRAAVEGTSAVFHFGGLIAAHSVEEFIRANGEGTMALAAAFRRTAPPDGSGLFLYCSSLAAGGPAPPVDRSPFPHVTEDDPPRPVSPYGHSKLLGEQGLAVLEGHARVVVFRPPAIYGPRDESILKFVRWIERGWMPIPPRGNASFSLIHVGDLARASVLALHDDRARGLYYLSDGRAHSWQDIGRMIGRSLGIRVRPIRVPMILAKVAAAIGEAAAHMGGKPPLVSFGKIRELQQKSWVCLPEKANREFGFTPLVAIEEGMEETVQWYRKAGWLRSRL